MVGSREGTGTRKQRGQKTETTEGLRSGAEDCGCICVLETGYLSKRSHGWLYLRCMGKNETGAIQEGIVIAIQASWE